MVTLEYDNIISMAEISLFFFILHSTLISAMKLYFAIIILFGLLYCGIISRFNKYLCWKTHLFDIAAG